MPYHRLRHWLAVPILLAVVLASMFSQAADIDHQRALAAEQEPQNWLLHGRTYAEQRHSPLRQINDGNAEQLGLDWFFDTNTNRGLEATPIVVDGVMYLTGTWSVVYALDARSGELLWEYDPQVPREMARKVCCDVVNRGVAVWQGKVYVGTLDGRLVAIDAATGETVWQVVTVDQSLPYTITGAPRVVKDKIIIGNGGAEYGVRGHVSAYDAASGERIWRFYTVPGNPDEGFENEAMAKAAETWTGEWWKLGGGGTVWDSMAYDPELDLFYLGVGNGSPWSRHLRSPQGGDNLYLSSIVAIRPDTGEYVWHYQVVPAESWDYTATQHMILADIDWQGETRKVLMQAPKSGFFMIIDRETGEFLSAEPYVEVNWATHYDPETGRPVEVEGMDYEHGSKSVKPSGGGGHNWQPMAYNPDTGLVYIPAMESMMVYEQAEKMQYEPGLRHLGIKRGEGPPGNELFLNILIDKVSSGHLLAWDPVQQKEAWRVPLRHSWNGGVLSTAGNLVLQGTADRRMVAYRADTGKQLWDMDVQTGIMAPPITYSVDGEQYVTVLAGWGGGFGLMTGVKQPPGAKRSRVLTFKLGGAMQLPPTIEAGPIPEPPALTDASDEVIARGSTLYGSYCSFCHGVAGISGGTLPDLRRLPEHTHMSFELIVHKGAFKSLGMPGFGDVLSKQDVAAIQSYLIVEAHKDKVLRETPPWLLKIKTFFYHLVTSLIVLFVDTGTATG